MPRFWRAAREFITAKDVIPVNEFVGFQSNGAMVMRDRRGTLKAEIPDIDSKGYSGGDDPLAIWKPTGSKNVDAAKAMTANTGWTYAAMQSFFAHPIVRTIVSGAAYVLGLLVSSGNPVLTVSVGTILTGVYHYAVELAA